MFKKRITQILSLAIACCLCCGLICRTDVKADEAYDWPTGPDIQGDGAIVVDAETGNILYEKNKFEKFYPASTTKVLTTLVALENSEMNEIVTVSYAADNYVSKTSSRMGLVEGEQITMEQALYGIMLESANEATYAVGEHVGGSIARFIKMMNKKAQDLGCTRSHFANSHGLHDEDHYTCPYDLCLIARAAYQNKEFMEITGTPTYDMPATNKNDAKVLTNHHWFLNKTMKYDYCIGGKTGATTQAGYALVTYAKKDGMTLISVVMHAPTWNDVYTDSKKLLEYVFDNFNLYKMSAEESAKSSFPKMFTDVEQFNEGRAPILNTGAGGLVVLPDFVSTTQIKKAIVYDHDVQIGHGTNKIGSIVYTYGDRQVGASDILYYEAADPINENTFNEKWPKFMIPIDVALDGVDPETLSPVAPVEASVPEYSEIIDFRKAAPLLFGVGGAVITLVIGALIVASIKRRN